MNNSIKKILIAEDEKTMSEALADKLSSSGFKPKVVFNGEGTIDALHKEDFDLLLLDLIMPTINGFQVLQKVKEMELKMPIVILSNLDKQEYQDEAKKLGADHYFVKANTTLEDIVKNIKAILKI